MCVTTQPPEGVPLRTTPSGCFWEFIDFGFQVFLNSVSGVQLQKQKRTNISLGYIFKSTRILVLYQVTAAP